MSDQPSEEKGEDTAAPKEDEYEGLPRACTSVGQHVDGDRKPTLHYHRIVSSATPPLRTSANAAGYDLASAETLRVAPGESVGVGTGLALLFPPGTYGRVSGRSGNSLKGASVSTGVLDPDYCGEIKIVMRNNSAEYFSISVGQRIAQVVVTPFVEVKVKESAFVALRVTERGSGGFGSSGQF